MTIIISKYSLEIITIRNTKEPRTNIKERLGIRL